MSGTTRRILVDFTTLLLAPLAALHAAEKRTMPKLTISLSLQTRNEDGRPGLVRESWRTKETAIIVCDMWDLHHCHNAVKREAEMAPRMNEVIEKARAQGVFVIHAPSSCMKAYVGHPARERAKTTPRAASLPDKIGEWCTQLPAEKKAVYPIDQTDGGEDDDPDDHAAWAKQLAAKGLNPRAPWTRQTDALRIAEDKDAISDSGVEIWSLLQARGIQNVILMGVHVNMCVAGRPFGLRQMAANGKHVVLVRDMTDSMYNPARWPHVDHFRGTALFIEHVEKYICPTITSDQIIGGKPILPIVWWAGASFEEIAKTGSDGIVVGFTRNSRPVLDQLRAVKQMGCVMLMDGSVQKRLMDGKTEFTPAMREYVSDAARNVIDHPAMFCWHLVDEPEGRALSPDLLQRYYELLAELDPYHPILITNDTIRGLYPYAACQDMFVPDPYVLPVKGGGLEREMTYVVSFMKAAQEAGKGRKLIGFTPQVFNSGHSGGQHAVQRRVLGPRHPHRRLEAPWATLRHRLQRGAEDGCRAACHLGRHRPDPGGFRIASTPGRGRASDRYLRSLRDPHLHHGLSLPKPRPPG